MAGRPPRELDWLQENWDRLGRSDPYWAVLTDPARKGGRWDSDEFFATGRAEVTELLAAVEHLLPSRERALDFGCGPGRLSRPLAERFERVDGVDVAPSMIELARDLDRRADRQRPRCVYHLNPSPDLALFADGTFDLAYSNITLQHMKPRLAERYLAELVRVLRPRGVLVFQLPSRRKHTDGALRRLRTAARRLAPEALHRLWRRLTGNREPLMDMNAVPRRRVRLVLERAGARVVEERPDDAPGPGWESYRYTAVKRA